MKKFCLPLLSAVFIIVAAVPAAWAAGDYYMNLNAGIYSPQSSELKDADYGAGANWSLGFGRQCNANVAYEMEAGNFQVKGPEGAIDFDVVPIVLSFKAGTTAENKAALYGIGGIGYYYAKNEEIDDGVFGFHLGAGFNVNLTRTWFIGADAKHLWTTDIHKFGPKLDGILATMHVGFRF